MRRTIMLLVPLLAAARLQAATPQPAVDFAGLIAKLDDPLYETRQEAFEELWAHPELRPEVETRLRTATAELGARLQSLVDQWDTGRTPNLPPAIANLVADYEANPLHNVPSPDGRKLMDSFSDKLIAEALKTGHQRFAMRYLAATAAQIDPDYGNKVHAAVRQQLRTMIFSGDTDGVLNLLGILTRDGYPELIPDYAMLAWQLGKHKAVIAEVAARIARRPEACAKDDHRILACLYRFAGDPAAAIPHAKAADWHLASALREAGRYDTPARTNDPKSYPPFEPLLFPVLNDDTPPGKSTNLIKCDGLTDTIPPAPLIRALAFRGDCKTAIDAACGPWKQPGGVGMDYSFGTTSASPESVVSLYAPAGIPITPADLAGDNAKLDGPVLLANLAKARILARRGEKDAARKFVETASALPQFPKFRSAEALYDLGEADRADVLVGDVFDRGITLGNVVEAMQMASLFPAPALMSRQIMRVSEALHPDEKPAALVKRMRELVTGRASRDEFTAIVKYVEEHKMGHPDSSEEEFGEINLVLTRDQWLTTLIDLHAAAKFPPDAIEPLLKRATEWRDCSLIAWTRLGILAADAGDHAAAVERFRHALELKVSAPAAWRLSRELAALGKADEAKRLAQIAALLPLGERDARTEYAELLTDAKDPAAPDAIRANLHLYDLEFFIDTGANWGPDLAPIRRASDALLAANAPADALALWKHTAILYIAYGVPHPADLATDLATIHRGLAQSHNALHHDAMAKYHQQLADKLDPHPATRP